MLEVFLLYFELSVDVNLITISQLMFGNLEEDFSFDRPLDDFYVKKKHFATMS